MDLPIMILSLYVVVAGLAVKHSLLLGFSPDRLDNLPNFF